MSFIFLAMSILFFVITFRLWLLLIKEIASFNVHTSVVPKQEVIASSIPPQPNWIIANLRSIWDFLNPFLDLLITLLKFLLVILFALSIPALSIYLLIKGQIWIGSIILSAFVVLILFLFFSRRSSFFLFPRNRESYSLNMERSMESSIFFRKTGKRRSSVRYTGQLTMPKKVYVGDARNISLDLMPSVSISSNIEEVFIIQDNKSGKSVNLQIRQNTTLDQFLEVELFAAGFTVDGEKKQRHSININNLLRMSYRWNCHFPNSGNLAIALAFRIVCSTDSIELGTIEHIVKVAQLDHLTQRQIWMIAALAGIAGFITTVLTIISSIPGLLHAFGIH